MRTRRAGGRLRLQRLVDIKTDPATLHALVSSSIEHAIQEWVSSGAVAHWINWHALKSADEKTVVLD